MQVIIVLYWSCNVVVITLSLSFKDATAYIARQRLAVGAHQERSKYGDDDNASISSQATANSRAGAGRPSFVPSTEGLPCKTM